jgi:hypothetical protein
VQALALPVLLGADVEDDVPELGVLDELDDDVELLDVGSCDELDAFELDPVELCPQWAIAPGFPRYPLRAPCCRRHCPSSR